ncbi:protein of unknown function [Rhodovastum atsumiense]|nr:protein of unknown function [Rhodovastum atsumiense]
MRPPFHFVRPARSWPTIFLKLTVAVVLALLGPAATVPSGRSDPFVTQGGICGPGHSDPGLPASSSDHLDCPCCQSGTLPALPPSVAALPVVRMSLLPAVSVAWIAPLAQAPAPPYASRAPPRLG